MEKAQKFHEEVMMPEILGKCFTRTDSDKDDNALGADLKSTGENGDVLADEISFSSLYESDMDISPTDESTSNRNICDSQIQDPWAMVDPINVRNLKNESIEEILLTFFEYEEHLKGLYDEHIKQSKRHYRPKDIPHMIALDVVSEQQFQAMVHFAEMKLVHNLEKEHGSSDIIFDAILPEWALAAFCRKFGFTKYEAIQTLKYQSQTSITTNDSDSEM